MVEEIWCEVRETIITINLCRDIWKSCPSSCNVRKRLYNAMERYKVSGDIPVILTDKAIKSRAKKGTVGEPHTVSTQVDIKMLRRLDKEVKRIGISKANLIRKLIESFLEERKNERRAKREAGGKSGAAVGES